MTVTKVSGYRSDRVITNALKSSGTSPNFRNTGRIVEIAGYLYLEVRCLGGDTHQTVALDIVRRPKATPIHELERYMRCKDCSQVRGHAYKRSHLVALRPTKISASDPAVNVVGGGR
jgi:hypothetical protein